MENQTIRTTLTLPSELLKATDRLVTASFAAMVDEIEDRALDVSEF